MTEIIGIYGGLFFAGLISGYQLVAAKRVINSID